MSLSKSEKYNQAFNIFLVVGMLVAVTITTIFKFDQPEVNTFLLLLASFGSVTGVINTVMSANGNILTFLFGFIDVAIGCVIYYENGIMATFALHAFYFLPMQIIGFWQWSKRGAKVKSDGESSAKVQAQKLTPKQWGILAIGTLLITAAAYFVLSLLAKETPSQCIDSINSKRLLDALVMSLNIAGQVLMSFAYVEQWYIWVLVNISSITLWTVTILGDSASANATVMLIKYLFYLLNSLNGLRIWLNLSKREN